VRTAVGGLCIGCILASLLMLFMSFLAAWSAVTLVGIAAEILTIHKGRSDAADSSIGFWIMIGAVVPVYNWVLKGFVGVL
jgi:hypothetical protein